MSNANTRHRRPLPRMLTAMVALLLAAAACTSNSGTDSSTDTSAAPLVVLAASSIAPALEAAEAIVGVPVVVSGAGSQVLAAQMRAGAPADLLVLADRELAVALQVELGLPAPVALAATGLSLIARPGLAGAAVGLSALRDGSFTLVLADVGVPLGDATRAALAIENLALPVDRVVSFEDAATSVVAKVASGEADLAIVYSANAITAQAQGRVQILGKLAQDKVLVHSWAQPVTARGADFLEALLGAAGQNLLRSFGFVPALDVNRPTARRVVH
jgi:molybdate transport system substrate-binding protein